MKHQFTTQGLHKNLTKQFYQLNAFITHYLLAIIAEYDFQIEFSRITQNLQFFTTSNGNVLVIVYEQKQHSEYCPCR